MVYSQLQNLPSTGIPGSHVSQMTPEGLWALAAFSALFIFSFVACAVAIFRNTERGGWGNAKSDRVPPIPLAKGFDSRLTPEDRLREVQWLEAMMDAPARQDAGPRDQRGSSPATGDSL